MPECEVYPRVGGANMQGKPVNPGVGCRVYPRVGGAATIPQILAPTQAPIGVYPRVGGGATPPHSCAGSVTLPGSIPAWAGEPADGGGCLNLPRAGLSPRGRGKLGGGWLADISRRSIPAWAGQTRGKPTASQQ